MNKKYLELTKLIRSKQNDHEILKCLSNYHENDIADMLTVMTPKERKRIYTLLEPQKIAVRILDGHRMPGIPEKNR